MDLLVLVKSLVALVIALFLLGVSVHKLLSKRKAADDDYEVFLSFRGVDAWKGFADYLHRSLIDAGIRVLRDDDELRAGEKLSPDLRKAIDNSKILIPIISENYGSSEWCLDILVHMMERKEHSGHQVLPMFYKVQLADVRDQMGSFGEAFRYSGRRFKQEVVDEWKQALREVGSLQGFEIANGREGELVKLVVSEVLEKLKKAVELADSDYLVGIDSHVEEVMKLVSSSATRCVGIYGMGGIGKTTLAKVIYNKLSNHFVHHSFIADIRESCSRNGINYLQNQLIFDMQKEKIQFCNSDEGIEYISSCFKEKKVLIILDDVDSTNQLKALAGNPDWFCPGSRIFVTTRDKSVLDSAGVDIKYEHKQMTEEQSLILFSRHAFRRDSPTSEFLSRSKLVVSKTGGLPLVIKVVGSFLCGKDSSAWIEAIEMMDKIPLKEVREKLMISYDALEADQKNMFLDIACFLSGNDARIASYMWNACGFCPRVGIEVLRSLSLIKVEDNHEFRMHDQIRDLGREIVRAENNGKPHRSSRLWDYGEVLEVLERKKGTGKIQAICLGNSTRIADKDDSGCINDQGSRTFTDEQFRNLPSLRFLHMSDVNLTGDFTEIFPHLRWLKWGNCPPTFAANNVHARELVILDLSGSSISEDWHGWHSMGKAENLKVLNLTGCHSLKNTCCLSAFRRLEILILRDCSELEQIDPSIGDMENLISLDLSGCSCLKELPPQVGKLEQLKELLLDQTMIGEIPSSIGFLKKLEKLSAKECEFLVGLPDSVGQLVNLRYLSLGRCRQLREIPKSIGMLKLLTILDLSGCSDLKELPEMGKLEQLKELRLDRTIIQEIPSSIGSLKKLEIFSAQDCKFLLGLPDSIGYLVNLRCLTLGRCHNLRGIPNSIGMLKLLTHLNLSGCSSLKELPPQMYKLEQLKELLLDQTMIREISSSFGSLKKLETLSAKDCELLVRLPNSIGSLVNLSTLVLSGCVKLAALPNSIGSLVNLRCMTLGRCQLKMIPNSIGKLKLLTQLDLSGCSHLERLPPQMGELKQLEELLLDQTLIREIPSSIGSLTKLEKLSARSCVSLVGLPDSIGRLVNFSTLVLSGCVKLAALPNSIGKLKSLTRLDLRGCSSLKELSPEMGELEQLKELLLDQTTIQEIPSSIGSLTKLEKLSARYCVSLVGLPDSIGCLVNLSTFVLSGCVELAALPDSIGLLVNLRCLSLRRCHRLRWIPDSIGKLKLLTQLDLIGCSCLEELLPQMGKLEQLKKLPLHQTMIQGILSSTGPLKKQEMLSAKDRKLFLIPDSSGLADMQCMSLGRFHRLIELCNSIGMLQLLTQLNLTGCLRLVELPPLGEIGQLEQLLPDRTITREISFSIRSLKKLEMPILEYLSLGWCHRLRKILNSFGMFDFLTQLNLSRCLRLEELPPQTGELKQLERLHLDETMIRNIHSSVGSLTKLKTISAKDCELLVGLPDSIGSLVSLLTLDLSGCVKLAALPDSIGFLVRLQFLSLGRCYQLREIPNSIGKLELLTQLDLSWTMIMELPESIGDLQNLKVLDISHTSIENKCTRW